MKQIKPRKLVIPPEQVEIGVKDSRQGMRIICEDLVFATEEFRFEIKGQVRSHSLSAHFTAHFRLCLWLIFGEKWPISAALLRR